MESDGQTANAETRRSVKRSLQEDLEPVLVKFDQDSKLVQNIHVNKKEFKIGRAADNDEVILSVLISRKHCMLNGDESGDWTITDLSSTCTLLNGQVLSRGVPAKVQAGDILQLSESEEFKFLFTIAVKPDSTAKRLKLNAEFLRNAIAEQKTFSESQANKRKALEGQLQIKQLEQENLRNKLEILLKQQEIERGQKDHLNKEIESLKERIDQGNTAEKNLQDSYKELVERLEAERLNFEAKLNEEKRKCEEALALSKQEKEALEAKMREEMEKWRDEQKQEWQSEMEKLVLEEKNVQAQLLNEKLQLEERLKQTEEALREQEARLQSTVIPTSDNCVILQITNDGTTTSTEELHILDTIDLTTADTLNFDETCTKKDEALETVGNIMDEQLTCSICSELLVTATTLNCTHTFCQYCINSWMKKRRECPNCRTKVKSTTRALVLDNFIEKMLETLPPQYKERRNELIAERSEVKSKRKKRHNPTE